MNTFLWGIRSTGVICLSALVAFISFGLVLALAWLPGFSDNVTYKTVTALLASAVAFVIGGYLAGLLGGQHKVQHGLAFGLAFGLVSFGYIFGPDRTLLIAVPISALLGGLGGWLAQRSS